jgi:FkbM family methyltransferase
VTSGIRSLRAVLGRTPLGPPYRRLRERLTRPTATELKNAGYDRDLAEVLRRVLAHDSTCVDVGANAGVILRQMVACAPEGRHIAVEPLPSFAERLAQEFPQVAVRQVALGTERGRTTFSHVTSRPAYSGLRERPLDHPDDTVEQIDVEITTLDELVAAHRPIRFVKVDVEGGEVDVLRGGATVLAEDQPFVAVEFGSRAAQAYGATAEDLYDVLDRAGLRVTTLARFLADEPPLDRQGFLAQTSLDFFFLAHA